MKLTILLFAASLPFLAVGGEGLYHVSRNRQQTALTCDQIATEPPRAAWIKLTGCDLDYTVGAGYNASNGQLTELFFPVRRKGVPADAPAVMIAATRDPAVLALAQDTIGNGRQPSAEAYTVMMLKVMTALHAAREIEGQVRQGFMQTLRTRKTLKGLNTPVVTGARIVDLNERPDVVLPGIIAGTGAILFLAGLLTAVRRVRPKPAVAIPSPGPVVEAPPALAVDESPEPIVDPLPPVEAPAARATVPVTAAVPPATTAASPIRGLMLLNLEPGAGVEAIEHAKPLGSREDLQELLGEILPGMAFDARGKGTVTLPDVTATIDLGASDMVYTAVFSAQGEGATEALHALVTATRWRVYAPKRGAFVDPADLDQR